MYLDRPFINAKLKFIYKFKNLPEWKEFFLTISNLYQLDTIFANQFPSVSKSTEDRIKQEIQVLDEMKEDIKQLTKTKDEFDTVEEIVYKISQDYLFLA